MSYNKYVYCSVYLLPATVALVANCVISVVMVAKLCRGRCCARFGNKAGSMTFDLIMARVRMYLCLRDISLEVTSLDSSLNYYLFTCRYKREHEGRAK